MGKQEQPVNESTLRYFYIELGLSGLETARRLGISRSTLTRKLEKFGIPSKNNSVVMKGRKLSPEHREKVLKTLKSSQDQTGSKNPRWKGGTWVDNEGYRRIRVNGEYVKEHRYVMEQHMGRKLDGYHEHVHHKDSNKLNNDIDNLVILTPEEHSALHWDDEKRANQSAKITELRASQFWSSKKKPQ